MPDFGPLKGGSQIILRGSGFMPFDPVKDVDNSNDTFCLWGPLGKTPAKVVSNTEARCMSPPNRMTPPLEHVDCQLTINN